MPEGSGVAGAAAGFGALIEALGPAVVALRGFYDVVKGVSAAFKILPKVFDDLKAGFDAIPISGLKTAFGDLFKVSALATNSIADSIPYFGAIIAVAGSLFSALVALVPAVLQTAAGLIELGLAALPGGAKVMGDVIAYLTAVLGQVFTPIVLTLMGALVTLADTLRGPLQLAGQSLADLLVGPLTAAFAFAIDWLRNLSSKFALAVDFISFFVAGVYSATQTIVGGVVSGINSMIDVINKFVPSSIDVINAFRKFAGVVLGLVAGIAGGANARELAANLREKDIASPNKIGQVQDPSKGLKAPNIAGALRNLLPGNPVADIQAQIKNKESVINALQAELGKKGQVGFSGIADVQKQVQMQALQSDIQSRALQVQIDNLEVARQQLTELKKRVPATRK